MAVTKKDSNRRQQLLPAMRCLDTWRVEQRQGHEWQLPGRSREAQALGSSIVS